ncbi:MAG: hypothetical protein EBR47_09160 [Betaproteobacteria bacterium]|nr:hypothetical protein [Betaproteobacteria bacterium]
MAFNPIPASYAPVAAPAPAAPAAPLPNAPIMYGAARYAAPAPAINGAFLDKLKSLSAFASASLTLPIGF